MNIGKVGLEIELMAPRQSNRRVLAEAIARAQGGAVRRIFYPQSELSQIPGTPVLENLTLGFEIRDGQGQVLAWCVDDLTLQADCDRSHLPIPGWYRIVGDDIRFMQIIQHLTDARLPIEKVLQPVAQTLGLDLHQGSNGMAKLTAEVGNPIAIVAPLPGERHRPCELITAPLAMDQLWQLEPWLRLARDLGFYAPVEGATHLHFDGPPLCSAPTLRNLVNLVWAYGPALKWLMGSNPHCQRLGTWPEALWNLVQKPGWSELSWASALEQLKTISLTKYCDFNLKNLVYPLRRKHTFEVRIFPVHLELAPLVAEIQLMTALLQRARETAPVAPLPPLPIGSDTINQLLANLSLSPAQQHHWQSLSHDR
jgi:hypothetical protein